MVGDPTDYFLHRAEAATEAEEFLLSFDPNATWPDGAERREATSRRLTHGPRPAMRAAVLHLRDVRGKIFPYMDRQTAEEFHERTSAEAQKRPREGWLTRREFPGGSAGFLFLQARALMSGVEWLPRELSVARFWDFDMHDDGSATVHVPTKELSEGPKASENELMKRLGSTMTIAMMSAFA